MPSKSSALYPDPMCKRFAKHILKKPEADSFFADLAQAGKAEPEPEYAFAATPDVKDDPGMLRELLKVHCAAGHPHNRVLQRALRDRGAPPEVVELAGRFQCDQCLEQLEQTPHFGQQ